MTIYGIINLTERFAALADLHIPEITAALSSGELVVFTYEGVLDGGDDTDAGAVPLGGEPDPHIAVLGGILKHQVLQRVRGRGETEVSWSTATAKNGGCCIPVKCF